MNTSNCTSFMVNSAIQPQISFLVTGDPLTTENLTTLCVTYTITNTYDIPLITLTDQTLSSSTPATPMETSSDCLPSAQFTTICNTSSMTSTTNPDEITSEGTGYAFATLSLIFNTTLMFTATNTLSAVSFTTIPTATNTITTASIPTPEPSSLNDTKVHPASTTHRLMPIVMPIMFVALIPICIFVFFRTYRKFWPEHYEKTGKYCPIRRSVTWLININNRRKRNRGIRQKNIGRGDGLAAYDGFREWMLYKSRCEKDQIREDEEAIHSERVNIPKNEYRGELTGDNDGWKAFDTLNRKEQARQHQNLPSATAPEDRRRCLTLPVQNTLQSNISANEDRTSITDQRLNTFEVSVINQQLLREELM